MKKLLALILVLLTSAGMITMDAKTKYFERNAMRTPQELPYLPDFYLFSADITVGYSCGFHEIKSPEESWDLDDLYLTSSNPSVMYTYSDPITTDEENLQHLIRNAAAVNAGTTTIYYSEVKYNPGGENRTVKHYTFPVTVQKGYPTAEYRFNGMVVTEDSATLGEAYSNQPVSLFNIQEFNYTSKEFQEVVVNSGITYTSSNPQVATVNANGIVTPLASGQTLISARWDGNDNWLAAETAYMLTVKGDGSKKRAEVHFVEKVYEDTLGAASIAVKAVTEPAGLPITYSVVSPAVAFVHPVSGVVTPHNEGVTIIRASFAGNEEYSIAGDFCQLVVYGLPSWMINGDPEAPECAELEFRSTEGKAVDTLYVKPGEEVTLPQLYNPANDRPVEADRVVCRDKEVELYYEPSEHVWKVRATAATQTTEDKKGAEITEYVSQSDIRSACQYTIILVAEDTSEDIYNTQIDKERITKFFRDGQILILRGEKVYTLQGQEVR